MNLDARRNVILSFIVLVIGIYLFRLFYMQVLDETWTLRAQEIADHNRRWFFSQEFFDLIVDELTTNFKLAFEELSLCNNYKLWINHWNHLLTYPEIINFIKNNQDLECPTQQTLNQLMLICQTRLDRLQTTTKDSIIKL